MSKNGDSSAYPAIERCRRCQGRGVDCDNLSCTYCDGIGHLHEGGLTKREYIAAIAMQAELSQRDGVTPGKAAEWAVKCADALLAELAKGPHPREFPEPEKRARRL